MKDLYPTSEGMKRGDELTSDEVLELENVHLYNWCLNHPPESVNFHLFDSLIIAMKFENFLKMINSHYRN